MEITIDKNAIPYRFDMAFSGNIFTFELNYNSRFDFFTMDITKDKEPIVLGEKIVYGKPLFSDIADNRLPRVVILPFEESGRVVERITWDNFGKTVVLLVGEGG